MNRQVSIRIATACVVLATLGIGPRVAAQAAMPQPQTQGDVTFLNGGAGDEEVQFIKRSMKDYSLALSFARSTASSAEYVASVVVTIKDSKGATVFESSSVGPWLLVRLPAGRYTVVASYHDVTQNRPVTAVRSATSVTTFSWT